MFYQHIQKDLPVFAFCIKREKEKSRIEKDFRFLVTKLWKGWPFDIERNQFEYTACL